MRKFVLAALSICICACAAFASVADDLEISITLVRGERSRDSGGSRSTINVAQDTIMYEQSFRDGRRKAKDRAQGVQAIERG